MKRVQIATLLGCLLSALVALPAAAAEATLPSTAEVLRKAQAALNPSRTSVRTLEIQVIAPGGSAVSWTARQARKLVEGHDHILTLLVAPESVAGFAVLAEQMDTLTGAFWVYLPPVRRVRHIVHFGRFENFLGTDLAVEDFGFLSEDDARTTVLEKTRVGGKDAFVLREGPTPGSAYQKVLTWIDAANYLPIRREFYDASGSLWKTQTFENVTVVEGLATPLRIVVVDEQQGGRTTLEVSGIDYEVELADDVFSPEGLPRAREKVH